MISGCEYIAKFKNLLFIIIFVFSFDFVIKLGNFKWDNFKWENFKWEKMPTLASPRWALLKKTWAKTHLRWAMACVGLWLVV